MSRYYVIVVILEYSESKVISLGDVDSAVKPKEAIISVHPSWVTRVSEVFLSYGVRCQVSYDVGMKLFRVHDDTCSKCW